MNLEGKIIVVFGEKLKRNGDISENFTRRMEKAREIYDGNDVVIISGGATRRGYPSEAEAGGEYFRSRYGINAVGENQSLTTMENVLYSGEIILGFGKPMHIISSQTRLRRIDFLCKKLRPEIYGRIRFVSSDEKTSVLEKSKEFLHLLYNRFDLRERFFLTRLLRGTFRNGR